MSAILKQLLVSKEIRSSESLANVLLESDLGFEPWWSGT